MAAFDVAAQAGAGVGVVSSAGAVGTMGSANAAADLSAGGSATGLPATGTGNTAVARGRVRRGMTSVMPLRACYQVTEYCPPSVNSVSFAR